MNSLPQLREDLQLFAAAANADGSPAWMIQDAVLNRFFRIGWLEFELLSRWQIGNPMALLLSVNRDTPLSATPDSLKTLIDFLNQHQLLSRRDDAGTAILMRQAAAKKQVFWKWLLHNYLFVRVPLVRPDRFFAATKDWVSFFYTRSFILLTTVCALLGVFMVTRQWDSFTHTFVDMLTPSGIFGYALALMFAKTLHELGHAYTATRYGIRVAHMGLAFLVMLPMLYTDTSESWRLTERKQRFRIAAAGICAEFAVAAYATLLWALLDDGALRNSMFFLATTSWVLTLAINASPFMRFDGYFLLSDALDIPNLHERAGALARVSLRRFLLGWSEPEPEIVPPARRRWMVAFAYITWLYRLTVFLGIAVAVYVFFFKLLGIFLFIVEIAWFVIKPIHSEVKHWPARWREIRLSRWLGLFLLTGIIGILLFVPWQRHVRAEAWAHADQQQLLYTPIPARLLSLRAPGQVKAGEVIAVLDSPDARSKAAQSSAIADALALQLDQTIGKADGHERRAVIGEQLAQQVAETKAQQAELSRLELRAPFDGVMLDQDSQARPGVWLNASHPIAMLVDARQWIAEGLVEQRDVSRLRIGDDVKFYQRGQTRKAMLGQVVAIDSTRTQSLPHQMLSTEHGGRIAMLKQTSGQAVPRDALYRVRIVLQNPSKLTEKQMLGTAVIASQGQGIAWEWFQSLASVLLRESGF